MNTHKNRNIKKAAAVFFFAAMAAVLSAASSGLTSFTTTDIDGKTVTQDIFSGYDLTMINIWATFCPPCLREMPELGKLAAEYKSKGVQIIGIVADVQGPNGAIDPEMVELAKEIIAKTKADYPHLLPSNSLYNAKLRYVSAVPETIFVDSKGNLVGSPYVGARSLAAWKSIIEKNLASVTKK